MLQAVSFTSADGQANDQYYAAANDDNYADLSYEDFDQVSLMPISCVNYMNGHFIKYELFENTNNFQCHTNSLGSFIVSISHYMRAYFNYQALLRGQDFKLPSDAGYLNCVMLQQTFYSDVKLYAKIGCQDHDTSTSTKLKLLVYTDKQCSEPYEYVSSNNKGYDINGVTFSSKVSFRPPFYSCSTCKPTEISDTFSKRKTFWYDDDAAANGYQIYKYFDDWLDDYFSNDDAYFTVQKYTNNNRTADKTDDDDFYTVDDDERRNLRVEAIDQPERKLNQQVDQTLDEDGMRHFVAAEGQLEEFEKDFWVETEDVRELSNKNYKNYNSYNDDTVKEWNMCSKIYKYGVWCDEECRDLDAFRIDEWSSSDMFLLGVMCVFMGFMMLLVFAKRVKAYEKASIYGEEMKSEIGMSPTILAAIFVFIFVFVIVLAVLRFVNETLVFAVVACILLFIYMLKLTLFETKTPALLGSAKKKKKKKSKDPYGYADDYRYEGDNPMFNY